MAGEEKEKKQPRKKPLVDVKVTCPECKSKLKVEVNRTRVSKPTPAEYEYIVKTETVKQGELFKDNPKLAKKTA